MAGRVRRFRQIASNSAVGTAGLAVLALVAMGGCGRPTAQEVARRVEKAYAVAPALEQTSAIVVSRKLGGKPEVRTTKSTFYYKRPRFLRLEIGSGTLAAVTLCDGKNLYVRAMDPLSWLREPAPKKWADSELLSLYVQPSQELMLSMLDGGKPLSRAANLSMAKGLERVNGAKCYVLSVSEEAKAGGAGFALKKEQRLWVGKRDFLIRKCAVRLRPSATSGLGSLEALVKKMESTQVEVTKPRLRATADEGIFSFKSPAGAHVISYEPGGPMGAWQAARDPMAAAKSVVGQRAPELSVRRWVKGPATSIAALKGKVVLLDFWATWCVPCVTSVPILEQLHKEYSSRGLVIIGIHDNSAGPDQIRQFMQRHGMTYRVGIDEADAAQRPVTYMRYKGTGAIPMAVLIDRGGVVRWVGHPADKTRLRSTIQALL